MKYAQHRVMGRTPDGGWVELYQGRVGECRTYISAMKMADRKRQSPVVTRRSVQQWLEQIGFHGSQAASSSASKTCGTKTRIAEDA